jgi:hypothetical protein
MAMTVIRSGNDIMGSVLALKVVEGGAVVVLVTGPVCDNRGRTPMWLFATVGKTAAEAGGRNARD